MQPIINAQEISKAFGAKPLFGRVSFTVSEADRIGLSGPNGSGKSTLLRILAGTEAADCGNLSVRKRLRLSYVEQDSIFAVGATVRSVVERPLERSTMGATEFRTHFAEILGRAGFENMELPAAALSGGWQKRLAIVEALVQAPDVLLLDEPTNHLDLAGIKWLEGLHQHAAFACVVVSHDRAKYAGFRRPILPHLSVVLTPGHVHTVYTNAVNLFDLALRAHHEISKL